MTARRAGSGEARLTEAERQALADALYGRGRATGRYCDGPVFETVERILADRAAGEGDLRTRLEALADRLERSAFNAKTGLLFSEPVVNELRALAATGGDHDE